MRLFAPAVLVLGLVAPHAQAEEVSKRLRGQQSPAKGQFFRQLESKGGLDDNETVRVRVTYVNKDGMEDALASAKTVYYEFEDSNVVVVELGKFDIFKLDVEDPNILSVEYDADFEEQGHWERDFDPYMDRHLADTEVVPYGISLVEATQVTVGSSPIKVCITDTGADRAHPDFDTKRMDGADRRSMIDDDKLAWRRDFRGHGTHVAGTVGAEPNNGIGVVGIGKINLFITRALNDSGGARESDIEDAVKQCVANGAKIISMSLGGSSLSSGFNQYLIDIYDKNNTLIFAAAGNDGTNTKKYPAANPRVISVGAIQEDKTRWPSSNWDSTVELVAPGKSIYSTSISATGYSYYSGTSMATPHAAGVAALVWSNHPECTNSQIRYALAMSAEDLGDKGCDIYFGYGMVRAKAAMDWLESNPCSSSTGNWGRSMPTGGCFLQ